MEREARALRALLTERKLMHLHVTKRGKSLTIASGPPPTRTPKPGSRSSRRACGVSTCVTMLDDGTRRRSPAHWRMLWTQPREWGASKTSALPVRGTGATLPIRLTSYGKSCKYW